MTIKSERVADLILSHLSQLMLTDVRDPRLHGVTIMEVRLDREIEHAEIFVNALGDESRRDDVMEGLRQAQGFLRKELASRLRLRRMPQLHFKWDVVLQRANEMEELLDSLAAHDAPTELTDSVNDDE
jgi:ribosome-binding factor A